MSVIGTKVARVGRTTGIRHGTIASFGYEFVDDANVTAYTDLLIIGEDGKPFSTHGDSGSLIVTDNDSHNALGLLWGGWQEKLRTGRGQENWTYGIMLGRVLGVAAERLTTILKLRDDQLADSATSTLIDKKRERAIAARSLVVGILLAVALKANIFEILNNLGSPWATLGWVNLSGGEWVRLAASVGTGQIIYTN